MELKVLTAVLAYVLLDIVEFSVKSRLTFVIHSRVQIMLHVLLMLLILLVNVCPDTLEIYVM